MERIKRYRFFKLPLAALAFVMGLFALPGDGNAARDVIKNASEVAYETPDFFELAADPRVTGPIDEADPVDPRELLDPLDPLDPPIKVGPSV